METLLVLAPVGARLDVSDRDRIMGGNRGAYRHSTSVSDFEECSLSPIHKGGGMKRNDMTVLSRSSQNRDVTTCDATVSDSHTMYAHLACTLRVLGCLRHLLRRGVAAPESVSALACGGLLRGRSLA